MKSALFAFAAILLCGGCTGNHARSLTALAPPVAVLGFAGDPTFETADKWSFTQAVYRYPAGYSFSSEDSKKASQPAHTIPVGDYLLGGMLKAARDRGVNGLKLTKFENSGWMKKGLIGHHMASLSVGVSYRVGGAVKSFVHEWKDRDIGGLFLGDQMIGPLYSQTPDAVFQNQIRPLMDEVVAAFAKELAAL